MNVPAETRGLVVTNVNPNSNAAERGIRRGDVILSINRQAVTSTAQVNAAVEAARRAGRTAVLLLIKRGQATFRRKLKKPRATRWLSADERGLIKFLSARAPAASKAASAT